MTDDRSKMRDGDMSLLDRIEVALRRVVSGEGQMRVPVEATDPDVVLADCKRELVRLQAAHDHQYNMAGLMLREAESAGAESERLRAELAEVQRDAERWRFYRDHGSDMIDGARLYVWIEANKLRLGSRDAAIDAARGAG